MVKAMTRRMVSGGIGNWVSPRRVRTYLENSSVHGLKYIVEGGSHWTEKLFWLASCLVATLALGLLASRSLDNFLSKPVSFVLDRDCLRWDTAFPAVSICEADSDVGAIAIPANRIFGEPHELDLETFLRDIVFYDGKCYACEEMCGKTVNCTEDLPYLVQQVRQRCQTLISHCSWMGKPIDCCEFFRPLITETGPCYTVNSIHTSRPDHKRKFYQNKLTGPGHIEFKVSKDVNVYVHTAEDVPNINTPGEDKNIITVGTNFRMAFTVTEIENDPLLNTLPIELRKCRFPYENNLKAYKYYSYSACIVNCRAEAQIHFCNCTHHLMPIISGYKTCSIEGLACLSRKTKTIGSLKSVGSNKPGLICPCIPSCTENDLQFVEKISSPYENANYSLIGIHMASLPKTRFQRYIVRTKLDLVVSLGGTAGLFLGASLLSVAELFYFMMFRNLPKRPVQSAVASNTIKNQAKERFNTLHLNDTCYTRETKSLSIHYLP